MRTSETITKITEAMLAAQEKIGHATRNAKGTHNHEYADVEAVLDAIKPPLLENGILLVQGPERIDGELVMVTKLIHASGEFIETHFPMIVDKNHMQGMGSASTYSRRYGLTAALGIGDKDDDGQEATKNPPKKAPPKKAQSNPLAEPSSPGEYIARVGQFKGKKIKDCDPKELERVVLALIDGAQDPEKAKKISKAHEELMKYGGDYLESLDRQPLFDESEEFPNG